MPTKAERLEKIEAQIAKLKAREAKIKAADRAAERKLDTRRKVIIGGLLLDAAEKDESYGRVIDTLMTRMTRDADKSTFAGWERPRSLEEATSPERTRAPSSHPNRGRLSED